jgi:hypothetical protein
MLRLAYRPPTALHEEAASGEHRRAADIAGGIS